MLLSWIRNFMTGSRFAPAKGQQDTASILSRFRDQGFVTNATSELLDLLVIVQKENWWNIRYGTM